MRKLPLLVLTCSLLAARPAAAAPMALEELLERTTRHNPELVALRQQAEAAEARVNPAGSLPDPRLQVELMDLTQPLAPKIQLSQMLMFPGKLEGMRAMERQMAVMARQEYEARRWMVGAEVQGAFDELYYLDRQADINKESQALLRDMIRVTNARYAVGQGMQADVLRPQLQLTRLMSDQLEYQERSRSTLVRLNALVGRPAGTPGEAPRSLPLTLVRQDRDALRALAEDGPMLQMARADLARAEAALALARLGARPDFELGTSLTVGSGMTPTSLGVMGGITLPLWSARKNPDQITEAERKVEVARARLEARRREVDTQVSTLLNQLARMERQLKLLNEGMIPQSRTSLTANLAAYQTGRGDYLMLLDAFMALYDNRMRAAMLLAEHEKMVAMLEAQVGHALKGTNP